MIDHVSLAVRDLAASAAAYEKFLTPLGLRRVVERPGSVGFGKTYPELWLNERKSGTPLPADRWQNLTTPTQVMVGGKSPTWLQHSTRQLADVLPNASHRLIPGQTHNVKARSLAGPLEEFFGH